MCCLESVPSICKADQSIWKNLRGLNRVVSQPDISLYKYGVTTQSSRDSKTVVSVVSVKKNKHYRDSDSSDSDVERCRSVKSFSSSSSSSSQTAEKKSRIACLLNNEFLGQHAGELLLDMHQFGLKPEGATTYTMAGVIIKETEIYFTVLEISKRHYQKLLANEELDEHDKAIIYYSKPHEILKEDYKNILMENFVKMNNIKDDLYNLIKIKYCKFRNKTTCISS